MFRAVLAVGRIVNFLVIIFTHYLLFAECPRFLSIPLADQFLKKQGLLQSSFCALQ